MYLDILSVHGGSGDPLYMLYYEEWRSAGHYQSLERDPRVPNNKVISHFNWKLNRSNSTTRHADLPDAATSLEPPVAASITTTSSADMSLSVSTTPTPSVQPALPPQLHSTRQRVESEGSLAFTHILSPINNVEAQDTTAVNQSGSRFFVYIRTKDDIPKLFLLHP